MEDKPLLEEKTSYAATAGILQQLLQFVTNTSKLTVIVAKYI